MITNKKIKLAFIPAVILLAAILFFSWNAGLHGDVADSDAASKNIVDAASSKPAAPKGLMASGVGGKVVLTWGKVRSAAGYLVFQAEGKGLTKSEISKLKYKKAASTKNRKVILTGLKRGCDHHFYVIAQKRSGSKLISGKRSTIRSTTLPSSGKSTIKNLLRTGISPIGSTLYVWGGGWNKADNAAGRTAKRTGLYSAWRSFYSSHKKNYDYRDHRYKITKGLDCSGFVGWTVYNNMQTKNGKAGYVTWAVNQGKWFEKKGFGKYTSRSNVKSHHAGDIMTCSTHVWISAGETSDGSTVILHASPPAVSLAGTPSSSGKKNSKAVKLARKYMKKYYGSLYKMYPSIVYRPESYSTDYGRMRWNKKTFSDPEGYRKMSADKVLADLFSER